MQIWIWGISIIVLTITFHTTSSGLMALTQQRIWNRLENRYNSILIWVGMSIVIGLFLTALHGLEITLWAAVYWKIGALNSFPDAVFYSMDSMTTRGASGLELQQRWRMLGALEAVDGVLLFGISTAFIFTMLQFYWRKFVVHNVPE